MGKVDPGKLARWADPTQNVITAGALGPFGLSAYALKKLLGKAPTAPGITGPPPAPDLTDLTIQDMARQQALRSGMGSRRNSFLTGPLGDKTSIPVLGKSLITGG